MNNTLHLNASADKRNGSATRNILLRAMIFSLANHPNDSERFAVETSNDPLARAEHKCDVVCFAFPFR